MIQELNNMQNNRHLVKGLLLILSFLISVIIFLFVYESISYIKYQNNNEVKSSIDIQKDVHKEEPFVSVESQNKLDKHYAYIKCMEKEDIMLVNCDNIQAVTKKDISKPNKVIEEDKNLNYVAFKDLNKSNFVIKIIYFFLILSLCQQVYLFLRSQLNCFLDIFDFHRSEWAINVAPMFGLLGTFFSMAMLLNVNNENIDTALIENFFDAVMTTIIGIIFYIINFYLKISIYPRIVESSND